MFFPKIEKEFIVDPSLFTVCITGATNFIPAPKFFGSKITKGGKHCPVALPHSITVICCFCPDV